MFGGLAVAGLGVSLQFPLISARGIEMSGGHAELAGSVNMFGSGIAVGIAPFALGFLSDRVGIHTAYLLLPGFIVAAVAAVVVSGRRAAPEGTIPA
jgi:fucose permease